MAHFLFATLLFYFSALLLLLLLGFLYITPAVSAYLRVRIIYNTRWANTVLSLSSRISLYHTPAGPRARPRNLCSSGFFFILIRPATRVYNVYTVGRRRGRGGKQQHHAHVYTHVLAVALSARLCRPGPRVDLTL